MSSTLLLLLSLALLISSQDCGCRGSSCGQRAGGGCSSARSEGCSGGERDLGGLTYGSSDSYQRDEGRTFKGSLERMGSEKRRGRKGGRREGERRGRNYDEDYDDEEHDRYKIGSLNSVNYESAYDDNERRRKQAKIRDSKKRRFIMKRPKRNAEMESSQNGGLCNSLLIKRGLETGMASLLNSNQTTPLSLSPASSLHALMKTRSKKAPSPWGIICGPSSALDQLDLSIDSKMFCYHQEGETSCFAFKVL